MANRTETMTQDNTTQSHAEVTKHRQVKHGREEDTERHSTVQYRTTYIDNGVLK